MASTFTQVFATLGARNSIRSRHIPMLNQMVTNMSDYYTTMGQIGKKRALMRWVKSTPEVIGLLSKVAKDIVYQYHFEPVNPKESGRNKLQQAYKFAQEVQYRRLLFSSAFDALSLGEAFHWKGKIKDSELKEMIGGLMRKEVFLERKEKEALIERTFLEMKRYEGIANHEGIDEDLLRPRKLRHIPSSTMEIIHDEYDVLEYRQVVGLREERFSPKEIIRMSFMDVDGRVSGFTPVESIIVQMELLRQMWQNMLAIHKNGGSPDKVFALENIQPNSPAYQRIYEQLQKYKLVETKHGNMLFTGKLTVHELQQLDKMQFQDMGLYITGVIAMLWEVPKSSIPFILGSANTKDDTGGNSEKGYWRNIEFTQMCLAETQNTQLWIPHFGVKLVFDNTFIQQDVQIQTARQLRLNNIKLEGELLSMAGVKLTEETLLKELGRDDLEVEEADDMMLLGAQSTMDQQLPSSQVNGSDDKRNISKNKRQEQMNTIARRGMTPTGVGKEMDSKAEIEFKQMIGSEENDVDFNTFVQLYNEDQAYHPGKPPRIFMRQNDLFTTFKFKSSDFVYRTILRNEELPEKRVGMMNLEKNIYRL